MAYKPAGSEGLSADWTFAVKSGVGKRSLDTILEQITGKMEQMTDFKLRDKGIFDMSPGKKAALLCFSHRVGDTLLTERNVFYTLDEDHLFVATETALAADWEANSHDLATMTATVQISKP
jgi:hypothetical protein